MANHVTNRLTIHAEEPLLSTILQYIKGEGVQDYIYFNKIIPMPSELDVIEGSDTYYIRQLLESHTAEDLLDILATQGTLPNDNRGCVADPLKAGEYKQYLENYINHASLSWYEWRCDNWGTRWNAYDQDFIEPDTVVFDTAWSTPANVIKELSIIFPDALFTVEFADEDLGHNTGRYSYKGGLREEDYSPPGGTREAYEFACDVKGWDSEEWGEDEVISTLGY